MSSSAAPKDFQVPISPWEAFHRQAWDLLVPPSEPAGLTGSAWVSTGGRRGPPVKDKRKTCWSVFTWPVQLVPPLSHVLSRSQMEEAAHP